MADDALLSDLCSICNTNRSKYRCPGCAARTCSLPCYKRHQQWAQCSGKRDPTKYLKKSEIATPAGIDHDFNYLTSVERRLESAERRVESTPLGNAPALQAAAPVRKQPTLQHYANAGVTVIRAPKGMSRQKANKTHISKNRKIVWTVEWIREDKTRALTESSGGLPLLQAQPFKPWDDTRKKRRAAEQLTKFDAQTEQGVRMLALASSEKSRTGEDNDLSRTSIIAPPQKDDSATIEITQVDPVGRDGDAPNIDHDVTESKTVGERYHFYLSRPLTSSTRKVLIPLDENATLADCIRGHTVLEFPTIYAFPIAQSPPPEEFMLEAEYLVEESDQQKEFESLMEDLSPETLRALKGSNNETENSEQIDNKTILDVLKQDFGAGG